MWLRVFQADLFNTDESAKIYGEVGTFQVMSRSWGYREKAGPGSLGVHGKETTISGLYLHTYVHVMSGRGESR